MSGECFERAWYQVHKEAWWNEDEKTADIDAAVEANMKDQEQRKLAKTPENPTGNKTIQRVIDRVRDNPTPKPGEITHLRDLPLAHQIEDAWRKNLPKQTKRHLHQEAVRTKPKLQSETLERLHQKVKKD